METTSRNIPDVEPVYRAPGVLVTEQHSGFTLLRSVAKNPRNTMVIIGPDETPTIVRWFPDIELWIAHIAVPTD